MDDAVRAVTWLHATENASVYLSVHARAGATVADIDAALYVERNLVKQMAMRRTIFGVPRDLLPPGRCGTRPTGGPHGSTACG